MVSTPCPGPTPQLRSAIDARAAELGWPAMHAELARIDPVTAARLAPGDAQRIQRALEVHRLAGVPLSALHGSRVIGPVQAVADCARTEAPRLAS